MSISRDQTRRSLIELKEEQRQQSVALSNPTEVIPVETLAQKLFEPNALSLRKAETRAQLQHFVFTRMLKFTHSFSEKIKFDGDLSRLAGRPSTIIQLQHRRKRFRGISTRTWQCDAVGIIARREGYRPGIVEFDLAVRKTKATVGVTRGVKKNR